MKVGSIYTPATEIRYGAFLNSLVAFVLIALAIYYFLIVPAQRMRKPEAAILELSNGQRATRELEEAWIGQALVPINPASLSAFGRSYEIVAIDGRHDQLQSRAAAFRAEGCRGTSAQGRVWRVGVRRVQGAGEAARLARHRARRGS
jgi:hypothetical protein